MAAVASAHVNRWERSKQARNKLNVNFLSFLFRVGFNDFNFLMDYLCDLGDSYRSWQYLFRIPVCTIRIMVKEVCRALWDVLSMDIWRQCK